MPKSKKSLSRKYLKVLGIISLVFGVLGLIMGIVTMFAKWDVTIITNSSQQFADILAQNGENTVRYTLGITVIFSAIISLIEGWLLNRASNDPNKSTFLLVLLVLSTISGIVAIITGSKDIGTIVGGIVSLAITILSLMAVIKARAEVDM